MSARPAISIPITNINRQARKIVGVEIPTSGLGSRNHALIGISGRVYNPSITMGSIDGSVAQGESECPLLRFFRANVSVEEVEAVLRAKLGGNYELVPSASSTGFTKQIPKDENSLLVKGRGSPGLAGRTY